MTPGMISLSSLKAAMKYIDAYEQFSGLLDSDVRAIVEHSGGSYHVRVLNAYDRNAPPAERLDDDALGRLLMVRNAVAALNRGESVSSAVFDGIWWKRATP